MGGKTLKFSFKKTPSWGIYDVTDCVKSKQGSTHFPILCCVVTCLLEHPKCNQSLENFLKHVQNKNKVTLIDNLELPTRASNSLCREVENQAMKIQLKCQKCCQHQTYIVLEVRRKL